MSNSNTVTIETELAPKNYSLSNTFDRVFKKKSL